MLMIVVGGCVPQSLVRCLFPTSTPQDREIIPGDRANVMPTNYGTALTKPELDALVKFAHHSTNANFT